MKMKIILGLLVVFACVVLYAENADDVYTEDQKNIVVNASKPQFVLKLKSNPTTGYSWALQKMDPGLMMVKHEYQASKSTLVGAGGFEWWTFEVTPAGLAAKQAMQIEVVYKRPWEKNGDRTEVDFQVTVN